MNFHANSASTLALAALMLIVGRMLVSNISRLREMAIPAPVVGGLLPALLVALLRPLGVTVTFDNAQQNGLLLAFFATVGLSAHLGEVMKGGMLLAKFFVCVVVVMIVQNVIGIAIASSFKMDPLFGLLTGSISLSGGHGTGIAWGTKFEEAYGLTGATSVGIGAATFGLVLGGLLGGPVGRNLAVRVMRSGMPLGRMDRNAAGSSENSPKPLTPERLITAIFLIASCIALGGWLEQLADSSVIIIPVFVLTLFVGVVFRNAFVLLKLPAFDSAALEFAGDIALSLFLSIALMSLDLWQLSHLATQMLVILIVQTAFVWFFVRRITFRFLGSTYDALLLAVGQTGFALGATPTAMVNMHAITEKYGWSPQAFIVVPLVGAFLIDIANAIVLSGFTQIILYFR